MPKRKQQDKTPLHYKRTKEGVEIKGDPSDVKLAMWFDLVTSKFSKLPLWALLGKFPLVSWVGKSWLWIKMHLPFLTLLLVVVNFMMFFLSG